MPDTETNLVHSECSERKRLARVSINQKNLAVQNEITGSWKSFRNKLFEMVDLQKLNQ
jgi:hypothetical protein